MSRTRKLLTAALAVLVTLGIVAAVVGTQLFSGSQAKGPLWHMSALYSKGSGWKRVGGPAPHGWHPRAARSLPTGAGTPGTVRASGNVVPPTNRWYSGMFFGDAPQPVFAMPLALQAAADGVALDLPDVQATDRTVSSPFASRFRIGLPTDGFSATRADPVSVTSTYASGGRPTGRLTVAEGWPYVSYTALRSQDVTVPAGLVARDGGRWLGTDVDGSTYGVAVTGRGGAPVQVRSRGSRIHLAAHQSLVAFAAPGRRAASALARGAVPISGVTTKYRLDRGRALTALTYRTAGQRPTVTAALPQRPASGSGPVVAHVDTVYGRLALHRGRTLTSKVDAIRPTGTLDLTGLGGSARDELRTQVHKDVTATLAGPPPRTDTYYGGKDLYRMARLYRLARSVGATDDATKVRARVVKELDAWLGGSSRCRSGDTRCFFYDTKFHGVVGRKASFGSDQFNDHHFHYGYFFSAAALVGDGHPRLLKRWRPTLTALSQDLASPVSDRMFPALRTFDPYAGHSWASGTSPFADGNNQESSSEAVNAWNGLALWAQADGHSGLARQATWQLSLEAASAKADWLQPTHLPSGYQHPFVSLNWGAKRDWATWFSGDPSAILGIQLLPLPPVYDQLHLSPARVRADLADATPSGYSVPFGDYLTMFRSLAEPRAALRTARSLPDSAIDDGDSRSYLLAWTLVHAGG